MRLAALLARLCARACVWGCTWGRATALTRPASPLCLHVLAAYRCAELALTLDGPLPLVDKFSASKRASLGLGGKHSGKHAKKSRGGPDPATSLLVHRLPPGTDAGAVAALFTDAAGIKPDAVTPVEFGASVTGRCHVTFPTLAHCGLAFDGLNGQSEEDPMGLMAKRVWLETQSTKPGSRRPHIKVRKMQ